MAIIIYAAYIMYTEVIAINKHRFLTELAKFLTFLSEEERQAVLAKFDEIFQRADSEEELAVMLGSPLKMAVEISRAFNKAGLDGAIERCVELSGVDMTAVPELPEAAEEETPAEEAAAESEEGEPAELFEAETAEKAEPSTSGQAEEAIEEAPGLEAIESAAQLIESENVSEERAEQEEAQGEPVSDEKALAEEPADEPSNASENAEEIAVIEKPEPVHDDEYIDTEPREYFEGADPTREKAIPVSKKLRPAALIFFIILAVPLGLAGIVIIIAASLAVLACAASLLGGGGVAVSLAFSGMTLFSDLIMTVGVALVCFALGLVILWLGIWLLIWGIGSFVKLILRLARSLCYKEVAIL